MNTRNELKQQTSFSSLLPPYFLNIEKEADGYVVYACKDTGRRNKMHDAFKTYAEAKKFCQKNAPSLKVMTV